MVLRGARPSSPSPSIERTYSATALKLKLPNRVPPSPHRSIVSRYATPVTQRSSPARPRPTHEVSREERRDDAPAPSRDGGETVCDYDTSATVLYELLESSTWERARARCRSHPEEVRTWIVRKDKSLAVRWKLLPLHAAIIFQSPNFLVSALLEQYPAAAARKDDQGMLPLHLAFRHKQEDEDLLELLLVKYPKAVMIKDRRDRVPLEHGRESKFSAKLMRLYADAVTAASRLVGGKGGAPPTPSTFFSSSTLTAGERALLDKDHKEELAELKNKYDAQIHKLKGLSSEQIQNLNHDAEKRVELIRADYEAQIRKLKDSHEQRCAGLRESHQTNLHHIERAAEEAHHALSERHNAEVNELRLLLNSQVDQDRELSDTLEKEIAHLQVALQERRAESELTSKHNNILQGDNEDFRNLLTAVQHQHIKLQEMLAKQQEDIEASRSIRNQLVQTLMRQDEGDKGVVMLDLADKLSRRIAHALDTKQASRMERERVHRDRGESRLERDRGARIEQTQNRLERDRDERLEAPQNRLERARGDELEEKRSLVSRSLEDFTAPSKKDEYGEVRILADEISAITDHSDY